MLTSRARSAAAVFTLAALAATATLDHDARAQTLIGASSSASASTGTGTTGAIACTGGLVMIDPTRATERDSNHFPQYISLSDCESNVQLDFAVTTRPTLTGAEQFSVWGTTGTQDCSVLLNRDNVTCFQLLSATTVIPSTVRIGARDIAAIVTGNPNSCTPVGVAGGAPETVSLYFLIDAQDGSDSTIFCNESENSVDLVGPTAPTQVNAGIGDSGLIITFVASIDTDTQSYTVYCDDGLGGTGGGSARSATPPGLPPAPGPPSDSSTGGASFGGAEPIAAVGAAVGVGGAGGEASFTSSSSSGFATTSTVGSTNNCVSPNLIPGLIPTSTAFVRGSGTGTTINATGLTNGILYACGVAGVDDVGNPGPLSQLSCAPPEPTDDFFTIYLRDGGQAGCEFGEGSRALGAGAGGLGLALLAVGLRRRRSRGSPPRRPRGKRPQPGGVRGS
ncbi:MAG TPA: hypothetical protein VGM56_29755 [Byssovorax sp.]